MIADLEDVQDRFTKFIVERDNIRVLKEFGCDCDVGEPILAAHHFCNINREHDRVTIWIDNHIRQNELLNHLQMVVQVAAGRFFNEPAALVHVFPFKSINSLELKMLALQQSGQKVFRGAYLMPGRSGISAVKHWCNVLRALEKVMWELPCITLLQLSFVIRSVDGLGDFLANQICTDMRYTRFYAEAYDWSTFVLAGPGTVRGLRRYMSRDILTGRPLEGTGKPLKAVECPPLLLKIREELQGTIPAHLTTAFVDINNLSNSFCEFDKFERALAGNASLRKYTQYEESTNQH